MGRKDERRNGRSQSIKTFWEMPVADTEREKNKARELRNSSWWRHKIARGICHYCGNHFKQDELTMDHIIPLSRGGLTEKINIVPSCKECNNKKKYLLPSEWEEHLQRIKGTPDTSDGDSTKETQQPEKL